MILPDKVYNVLKWICIILLPDLQLLWFALGKIWGFPYLAEIGATIIAIDTFLGTVLGISAINYKKLDNSK